MTRRAAIVILTGAGVSAESGLGTFRDVGGIWSRYDLAEVATPEGYARNPDLVLGFYNARRENAAAAEPNRAHRAIARLQRDWPGEVTLITQNIDDLHERAGSPDVVHMHGEIMKALCAGCGHRWGWRGAMSRADACPACGRAQGVRPDVVWFGEVPYEMELIGERLARADLFVAIGTSGAVYPAAGFVAEAARAGAATVEINLERSEVAGMFGRHILGPAGETVPRWVGEMLAQVP
ncbi:NAD-dependent deacylase [Limibaculum sp. FT325]|uniref:NAD-dependent deacylase n=1 Tax=Thermohalobaculum sediminis TaxID=2939436 RepID=UPI0020BF5679|nr:NAD-dependent deacylase [Limibaculum sediminis]MCL5777150.1 NAD-dependent deacylase [Limibaculum sediminis]